MSKPADEILGPVSSSYVSQRLRLHYVDWGNEHKPPLLLVHGGRDHARSWDWVARDLRRDWHVIALDLRGHGDSSWTIGGHYTLSEFVLDLAQLVDLLDAARVTLVGHSLGGAVSIQYTAVFPDRVDKLVAIEGLGPPPEIAKRLEQRPPWERISDWIKQVREFSARQPKRYPTIKAAAKRRPEILRRTGASICSRTHGPAASTAPVTGCTTTDSKSSCRSCAASWQNRPAWQIQSQPSAAAETGPLGPVACSVAGEACPIGRTPG